MYEARQQKPLTYRTLPLIDGKHKQNRLSICEIIQKRRRIDPGNHIELDKYLNDDRNNTLIVHYKYCKISCKEYTNTTTKLISSEFSGCLMAIFHCLQDIGDINMGKDYVAHVANDDKFTYYIDGKEKEEKGRCLLKDMVDEKYIDKLRYINPFRFHQSHEGHIEVIKRYHENKKMTETGIIYMNNGDVINSAHRFDDESDDEAIEKELVKYEDDYNSDVLNGFHFYKENLYDQILLSKYSEDKKTRKNIFKILEGKKGNLSVEILMNFLEDRFKKSDYKNQDFISYYEYNELTNNHKKKLIKLIKKKGISAPKWMTNSLDYIFQ